MKNILYLKTPDYHWLKISDQLKKNYDWNCLGWIGNPKKNKYIDNIDLFFDQNIFFLNKVDSYYRGKKLNTNSEELYEIKKKIKYHYPIIIELIDRWIDNSKFKNNKLKIKYINKLVNDIFIFLKFYKIDLIISPTIPHRIYDYVFYLIFNFQKKPFLMIEQTSGVILKNDILKSLYFPIFSIENRTNILSLNKNVNKELSKQIKKYLQYMDKNNNNFKYDYVTNKQENKKKLIYKLKSKTPKLLRLIYSSIKDIINFKFYSGFILNEKSDNFCKKNNFYSHIKLKLNTHNDNVMALNYYLNNSTNEIINNNYVYFAAGRTPERTQCPDAGFFFNPLRILNKLSKCLPNNVFILYKEHPSCFLEPYEDFRKSKNYYEYLKSFKNIIFVNPKVNSNLLIDNCLFVASCSGTVSYEASLRGKKSIIFGSTWYENLSSVYRIFNTGDLKKFIDNFSSTNKSEIFSDLNLYLNKLYCNSYNLDFRRKPNLDETNFDSESYKEKIRLIAKVYYDGYSGFKKITSNQYQ